MIYLNACVIRSKVKHVIRSKVKRVKKEWCGFWCEIRMGFGVKKGDVDVGAEPAYINYCLYLASIIQTASSPSPVLTVYYSVKFYHDLYGCLSPTESSLLVNVLEAAKRKLAKSISKKEPVTIALLQSVYSRLFVDSNIYNQRIICAMLIAFVGFSRNSD